MQKAPDTRYLQIAQFEITFLNLFIIDALDIPTGHTTTQVYMRKGNNFQPNYGNNNNNNNNNHTNHFAQKQPRGFTLGGKPPLFLTLSFLLFSTARVLKE